MSTLSLLLRGLVLGFSIALPVGPIGVLCIKRTLAEGRVIGFVTGLGAATADMLYGAVSAFGLTAIAALLIQQQQWIRLLGGVALLAIGIRTLRSKPAPLEAANGARSGGRLRAYGSTLLLTLANPTTILSFAAVFAAIGLGQARSNYVAAALLVLGVFCGSALWWLLLSTGISLLRSRLGAGSLRWLNWLSGILLMGFGALALVSVWA